MFYLLLEGPKVSFDEFPYSEDERTDYKKFNGYEIFKAEHVSLEEISVFPTSGSKFQAFSKLVD